MNECFVMINGTQHSLTMHHFIQKIKPWQAFGVLLSIPMILMLQDRVRTNEVTRWDGDGQGKIDILSSGDLPSRLGFSAEPYCRYHVGSKDPVMVVARYADGNLQRKMLASNESWDYSNKNLPAQARISEVKLQIYRKGKVEEEKRLDCELEGPGRQETLLKIKSI